MQYRRIRQQLDMGRVRVIQETPRAIRVVLNDFGQKMLWIPKKLIDLDSEVMAWMEEGQLVIEFHQWWLDRMGFSDKQYVEQVIAARWKR